MSQEVPGPTGAFGAPAPSGGQWSVDLLAEYFAAVSLPDDEDEALRVAVERAAEQLECDFAAVAVDGRVRASVGLGRSAPLLHLPQSPGQQVLVLPGIGAADGVTAPMSGPRMPDTSVDGTLTLARAEGSFGPEEEQVVRAMATVVGLVLRNLRMLAVEQGRQRLLQELLEVQRSISRRRPLQEVLDAVIEATSTLLDGASAALLLAAEPGGPLAVVARTSGTVGGDEGGDEGGTDVLADAGLALRVAERSVERGELLGPGEAADLHTGSGEAADDVVAVPVQVHGAGAGALVAWRPGWGPRWQHSSDMLALFAQQVSIALTDADTVRRMNQALHDSLTGLPERALFRDRLEHACSVAQRRDEALSLMFLDLDGFKQVNDTYGHAVGDAVLVEVVQRITAELRESDTAGRLGGDEFAVLLEGVEADAAREPAQRIVAAVARPMLLAGHEIRIGVSIGIADRVEGACESDGLLASADASMYDAKRAGRGQVVVAARRRAG